MIVKKVCPERTYYTERKHKHKSQEALPLACIVVNFNLSWTIRTERWHTGPSLLYLGLMEGRVYETMGQMSEVLRKGSGWWETEGERH